MNSLSTKMVAVVGVAFAGAVASTMLVSAPAGAEVRHEASVLCAAGTCTNNGPGWDVGFGNVTCPNGLVAPGIALVPPHGIAPLASASCQQPRLYG